MCLGIVNPVGTDGRPPTRMGWSENRERERVRSLNMHKYIINLIRLDSGDGPIAGATHVGWWVLLPPDGSRHPPPHPVSLQLVQDVEEFSGPLSG